MLCAYAAFIYTIASVFYWAATRQMNTPFKDSLTEEQKKIRSRSVDERSRVFMCGGIVGLLCVLMANPFG